MKRSGHKTSVGSPIFGGLDRPGDLPLPPSDLDTRALDLRIIPRAQVWFRLHESCYDPIFFNRRGTHRFNPADGRYGVMCAGTSAQNILLEIFGDRMLAGHFISDHELNTYTISTFTIKSPHRVADIRGDALFRLGADGRLFTGSHRIARLWARALMLHRSNPAGFLYHARWNPTFTNLALFEVPGIKAQITVKKKWMLRDFPNLAEICRKFGIHLGSPS